MKRKYKARWIGWGNTPPPSNRFRWFAKGGHSKGIQYYWVGPILVSKDNHI